MAQYEELNVGKVRITDSLEITDEGSVTQATSITTGVTINHTSGQITTVSSNLAAAGEAKFTVTNSKVKNSKSVVIANIGSTSSAGSPIVAVTAVAAGSFDLTISNLHASAALDNTLTINFAVINAY